MLAAGKIKNYLNDPVSMAPLAVFRVLFGGLMLAATLRFMLKGWVDTLYVQPKFYFSYYGFEWVKPLGAPGMYAVFSLLAFSALMLMLGCFYRVFATVFFLAFTYVELLDKSNYLNHYYFVSIVSLLLIFVPAHRYFSLDVWRKPELKCTQAPRWTILIFQLQLGIVYFYAGLAKLNYDWLFRAQPLRIWLPPHSNFPVIGFLFSKVWVAFFFSWFGALYDLSIPFLLLYKRTRFFAYFLVIAFHVMTALLFPIGMFPYVMILATLIFFPAVFHKKLIAFFRRAINTISGAKTVAFQAEKVTVFTLKPAVHNILGLLLVIHFTVQLLFPFRFLLYPGNLFWTEQGYRFSWRVMLMEKAGTIFFTVRDAATGRQTDIRNGEYLTLNQEKMMASQPDMILQFAHFLKNEYRNRGFKEPEVYAEAFVTLNGSGSRPYILKNVDLAKETDTFAPKTWILPFTDSPARLADGH